MSRRKIVLHLWHKTKSYGTGIVPGWEMVKHWLKDIDVKKLHWVETNYICCKCQAAIEAAAVPAPVTVTIYRCKRGHKFCFEFTD